MERKADIEKEGGERATYRSCYLFWINEILRGHRRSFTDHREPFKNHSRIMGSEIITYS